MTQRASRTQLGIPLSGTDQSGAGGFVLVNALVLVLALAALSTWMLSRAEGGRMRLQAGLEAAQITLALDAMDALALSLLHQDQGAIDHTGEGWARPIAALELAPELIPGEGPREVGGEITDLQGRFNVNWLSDSTNLAARAGFDRLLTQLALPAQTGQTLTRFLRPGTTFSRAERAPWLQMDRPRDPIGGPLLNADQLAEHPGLSPATYARLRPWITALPGDSALNVNTAPAEVLQAFLPHLPPAALSRLLAQRRRQPFASVDAFLIAARLEQLQEEQQEDEAEDDGEEAALRPEQLTVGSSWFRLDAWARQDGPQGRLEARRSTLLQRRGPTQRPALIWQITRRP